MTGKTAVRVFLFSSLAVLAANQATADSITKPHAFTAGTPAKASEVNANFDTVYEQVNKIGNAISVGDGSGNVGVGTTSPDVPLHVVHDVNSKIKIESSTLSGQTELQLKNAEGVWQIMLDDSSHNNFPASALGIRTNSGEIMTLLQNGNVGIGTSSPATQFVVKDQNPVRITADSSSDSYVRFARDGTNMWTIGNDVSEGDDFFITYTSWADPAAASFIIDHSSKDMLLNPNGTGNVGIGTTTPTAKLYVEGADAADAAEFNLPIIRIVDDNPRLRLLDTSTPDHTWAIRNQNADLKFIHGFQETEYNTSMFISSTGNVGVGTETPAGKLDVNGTIYHRGAELHADYVFELDYQLESIEVHAEKMWREKHLPAVPKARTDENGREVLEVGAHRKGMLEELEKSHIYIARLNDTIKEQQRQISAQQAQIFALIGIVCQERSEIELCDD
ncbi:MAG: SlyX family protein [Gammaproteobacteria bacterium]|nr:SlyX family protein [Gammaproteobacteria bacterium]